LEQRGTIFVEAMLVIAVIGVLAFLIGLLIRAPQQQQAGVSGAGQPSQSPRWYEFTLALLLLAAIAAFAIWIISTGKPWVWGENIEDWQTDTRTIAFAAIMVALGVIGLGVSLIYALVQSAPGPAVRRPIAASAEAAAPGAVPMPSPLRILGLLLLVVAIILLCWIALPSAQQHGLIVQLIYPATLGLSLVLLFDKATRTWGTKGGAETFREWLFCDLLVFLLVLAFLHLRGMGKPEAYTVSFWDLLNVVLFFAAFWIVDRTAARGRVVFANRYLGVATQASWWATMWPFLIVAAVFFVLEAVTLASSDGDRQTLPAVKDVVFVVLYAVLLIVAVKSYA
jgi:hypothetical protein